MKHKLAEVMLERNATKHLKGKVHMDEAYLGGERVGPRGRGAVGKTPVVAAIETTNDGKPHQIIRRRVKAFSKFALAKLASTALQSGAEVVSDVLKCSAAGTKAGCTHAAIITGSGAQAAKTPAFKWPTPRWATSRPRLLEPTEPRGKSTFHVISPNSNIASTDDMISAQ